MTELHEVGDDADAAIPWAKAPSVTIICDIDSGREMLRMPALVILPPGAIVQLGHAGNPDNPPQDGIVRRVPLWGAAPGATPLLRLDVDITLPD
jgi:hypothetical protein